MPKVPDLPTAQAAFAAAKSRVDAAKKKADGGRGSVADRRELDAAGVALTNAREAP